MSLFTQASADALLRPTIARLPYLSGLTIAPSDVFDAVRAAEADMQRRLRVFFVPTEIFSGRAPTPDELTALAGKPWAEEPGYDYEPAQMHGDRWGFMALRQRPVTRLDSVTFEYPGYGRVWDIPTGWFQLDKKYGHLQLVPSSSMFAAPFGTFILQLMGGGRVIPFMVKIRYQAGLANALTEYPDLVDLIRKAAMVRMVQNLMLPTSGSLSVDGLSQSTSVDVGKWSDDIDRLIEGPPGTNGGLRTAIHGITVGFLG